MNTDVLKLLNDKNIKYKVFNYDTDGSIPGEEIAAIQKQNPSQVLKTLTVVSNDGRIAICSIPVNKKLDYKKVSKIINAKNVKMLPSELLKEKTGYVHGACSPFCLADKYTIILDESINNFNFIYISAGKLGLQVQLLVSDIKNIIPYISKDITKHD